MEKHYKTSQDEIKTQYNHETPEELKEQKKKRKSHVILTRMLNQLIDLSNHSASKNRCLDYRYPEIACPFWKPTFLRNSDKVQYQ